MSAQLTTDPQGTSAASTSTLHNSPQDYLKRILNARVYDVAIETPSRACPGAEWSAREHRAVET